MRNAMLRHMRVHASVRNRHHTDTPIGAGFSLRLLTTCAIVFAVTTALPVMAQQVIYSDAMGPGWENWSWATVNLSATSPVYQGSYSTSVILDQGWSGLYFHNAGVAGPD